VKDYPDQGAQDWEDSQSLYQLLEEKVVPLFYQRDESGLPTGWLRLVKESIRSVAPVFSTTRMLKDYTRTMYMPAMQAGT